MARSGSPPWMRSDVTRDDPIWQKEVSGQVRYPPLRFLSRHSLSDPDFAAGTEVGRTTSGMGMHPDDGSDVSISSADTVIAVTLSTGNIEKNETQHDSHAEYSELDTCDYVDHVADDFFRQKDLHGKSHACAVDTDNDSSPTTINKSTTATNEFTNRSLECQQTGNTSYYSTEYADDDYNANDSFFGSDTPTTGSGSGDDKYVPVRRNQGGEIDFDRSLDPIAVNNRRDGGHYTVSSSEWFTVNNGSVVDECITIDDGCGSVNTTNHRPANISQPPLVSTKLRADSDSVVNAQRLSETDVNGETGRPTERSDGALVNGGDSTLSAELGITCKVDAKPGVYDNRHSVYDSSTETTGHVVRRTWTSPICGPLIHSAHNDDADLPTPDELVSQSSTVWPRDLTVYQEVPTCTDKGIARNQCEVPTDRVRYQTLTERKHISQSITARNELSDDGPPRMKPSEAGHTRGSLPEATVSYRSGMRGMRYAGQHVYDNSDASSASGNEVDVSWPLKGVDMEQDEGLGEEVIGQNGSLIHPSLASVQSENVSDNSSVDSEGTPSRKKSALKNGSSNKDGIKRATRKVRFAEPLVMRENQPLVLTARERLGLSKDSTISLGNGLIMRPRIQYVNKTDDAKDKNGGSIVSGGDESRPENPEKTPRFIIKRGPPMKRVSGLPTTKTQSVGNVNDQSRSKSSSQSGSGTTSMSRLSTEIDDSDGKDGGVSGSRDSKEVGVRNTAREMEQSQDEAWHRSRNIDENRKVYDGINDRVPNVINTQSGYDRITNNYGSASSPPESNSGGNPKPKPRITLSRSTPITRNRPKPSPELRRRPPSPIGNRGISNSVSEIAWSSDGVLRRETPLRRSTGNREIRHAIYVENNVSPEREIGGNSNSADGVPIYMKLGQKVLPSADMSQLRQIQDQRTSILATSGIRSSGDVNTSLRESGRRSMSYENVSNSSVQGDSTNSSYQRAGRFSSVPELAVIPAQSDSPSVPSPVSGDSGISSSSSVTDLNRDQSLCATSSVTDGLADNFNTLNYIRNEKTKSILTRVYETEEPRNSQSARYRRPVEREIPENPSSGFGSTTIRDASDGNIILRRTSSRNSRRGQEKSAIEGHRNSELDKWSRGTDRLIKDDAGVRYLTSDRKQNGARLTNDRRSVGQVENDTTRPEHHVQRNMTSSDGSAGLQHVTTDPYRGIQYTINTSPSGSYRTSGIDPEEENPYGRFLRSATNRKSTRGRLVPIPMDILNPRPPSHADSTPDSDVWCQPYNRGDDFRRLSNSSGYSTQDVSYDLGSAPMSRVGYPESPNVPNSGSYIGLDSFGKDVSSERNSSATFEKNNEPRFRTTAEIYKLLREQGRNPFVKTNGYT